MKNLEKIIGYEFKDKDLLKQAFTHCGYSTDKHKNYERLEFLGDRVLGLAVADILYNRFLDEPEGSLSQRFTSLVCKECVSDVALRLGFDKFMKVKDEVIRHNQNVLCDICEAVIGAMFIDGGIDEVKGFVEKNWLDIIEKSANPPKDSKTTLQELLHIKGFSAPVYKVLKQEGTEHEPVFYIEVSVEEIGQEIGLGKNKKLASAAAAIKMLERLETL